MLKKLIPLVATAVFFFACSDDSSTSATGSQYPADAEWRSYCLEVINKYRATEDAEPLTLADDSKQLCADKQAAADLKSGKGHAHFKDCGEFSQNSGTNISLSWVKTEKEIIDTYVEMMWDEKKLVESGERDPDNDADFPAIGHYLNLRRSTAKSVACGIAKSEDEKTAWFNIDFF